MINQYWGNSPSARYLIPCNLPNNLPVCSTDSILLIVSQLGEVSLQAKLINKFIRRFCYRLA